MLTAAAYGCRFAFDAPYDNEKVMTQLVQLTTQAIPQADILWDVIRVPAVVRAGACDPEALATALGAKVARQAVYYTQAARILGLVAERSIGAPIQLTPTATPLCAMTLGTAPRAAAPDAAHRAHRLGGSCAHRPRWAAPGCNQCAAPEAATAMAR